MTYDRIADRIVPIAQEEIAKLNAELLRCQKMLAKAEKDEAERKIEVDRKEQRIRTLEYTKDDQANIFIQFIEDYASDVLDNTENPGVPQVRSLIEEHEPSDRIANQNVVKANVVRIPEAKFWELQNQKYYLEGKLGKYQALVKEQMEMIRSQSRALDERVEDFGKLAPKLAEKDSTISALREQNEALNFQIEHLQAAEINNVKLRQEQAELVKHCSELEVAIQDVENSHKVYRERMENELTNKGIELTKKEAELTEKVEALRVAEDTIKNRLDQHLGQPKEPAVRHVANMIKSAESKPITTESRPVVVHPKPLAYGQTIKQPPPPQQRRDPTPPPSSFHWYTGKGSSFLPWKNKSAGCGLPSSHSMVSLSTVDTYDKVPPPPHMDGKRFIDRSTISRPMSPRVIDSSRLGLQRPLTINADIANRPRSNSVDTVRVTTPRSPVMDKSLPSTPPFKPTSFEGDQNTVQDFSVNVVPTRSDSLRTKIPDPFINAPILLPSPSHSPHRHPSNTTYQPLSSNPPTRNERGKQRLSLIPSEPEEPSDPASSDSASEFEYLHPNPPNTANTANTTTTHAPTKYNNSNNKPTTPTHLSPSSHPTTPQSASRAPFRPHAHPLQPPSQTSLASTTSSTRRLYRKSIDALNLLDVLHSLNCHTTSSPGSPSSPRTGRIMGLNVNGTAGVERYMEISRSFRLEEQRANPPTPSPRSAGFGFGFGVDGAVVAGGRSDTTPTISPTVGKDGGDRGRGRDVV